ncbi:MAG: ABC transporter substrate-binding protein, partial [Acetobacter malorum]
MCAMVLVLLAGAGGVAPQAARAEQPLRWGADASADVPYTFHDPNDQSRLTGFEYDLMQSLGEHLGKSLQFVQNDWDGLIPGLQRGLYEMVICGIEITPEHAEGIDFSVPYYVTSERIVVRRNGPALSTLEALDGHVIGTMKATQAERILANHPQAQVRTYDEETNVFMDLVNGRTDAVLIDGPIAQYYGATNPDLQVVGEPIGTVSYGIAFAKGKNAALREQVNTALTAMKKDGSLHRILARWNLWT